MQNFCIIGRHGVQKFCNVWQPKRAKILHAMTSNDAEILQGLTSSAAEILHALTSSAAEILHALTSAAAEILQAMTSWVKDILYVPRFNAEEILNRCFTIHKKDKLWRAQVYQQFRSVFFLCFFYFWVITVKITILCMLMFFEWQDKLVKITPRLETKGY